MVADRRSAHRILQSSLPAKEASEDDICVALHIYLWDFVQDVLLHLSETAARQPYLKMIACCLEISVGPGSKALVLFWKKIYVMGSHNQNEEI